MKTVNPYAGLEDYQFWRRAVSNIEHFLFDPVTLTKFVINKDDKVATAGSCFAQHISSRLSKIGFNYYVTEQGEHLPVSERKKHNYGVFSARFGNLYTTRQLLQLFQQCFEDMQVSEGIWETKENRWVDALRPQITPNGFRSEEEVRHEREVHLAAVREMFENCDVFVFTLGLTEAWCSRQDGITYPLAPGVSGGSFDASIHQFVNFGVTDVVDDLRKFLEKFQKINPKVRVLLTVSPVPLIATYEPKNVLVSTTYSKSVLRVAAEMVCNENSWVEYFPSFEIITGNYANSKYYESDYRGINSVGVDHAMRCFLKHFTPGIAKENDMPMVSPPTEEVFDTDVICDEDAIDQISI